ncbi:MAG TPA: acyl-CoA thioesterase domain-containing protein [Mycobacterium sp.]|nr:acyl-CoA thioesterase domain-containing protein [Mycobacterium sp.]
MTERPAHFTATDDGFVPSQYAKSHWGPDHLNGPAVVGLAARALELQYGSAEFMPARLTVDLFKAARGVPTTLTTRLVRDGRRVRNAECDVVQNGDTVARAIAVWYRRSSPPPGELWTSATDFEFPAEPLPGPDEITGPYIGSDGHGWTRSIAEHQNADRTRFLDRPIDVVAGERNSRFVSAAMIAEGTSLTTNLGSRGVGYINGDLTVGLARLPVDDWLGVQGDSHWESDGIAVGTATLFDSQGAFGSGMVTAIANTAAQIDFGTTKFKSPRL